MKNLIEALRETADGIESGKLTWDWFDGDRCNCGLVAHQILEKQETFHSPIGFLTDRWECIALRMCPVTGLPENEILRTLTLAGLGRQQIIELENCANREVLRRMNATVTFFQPNIHHSLGCSGGRTDRMFAVRYFRAYADILEEAQTAKLESIELRELKPIEMKVNAI